MPPCAPEFYCIGVTLTGDWKGPDSNFDIAEQNLLSMVHMGALHRQETALSLLRFALCTLLGDGLTQ
jgi:hypothetical protein